MTQDPDPTTTRMIGHFAALLVTVLHQRGVLNPRTFADHLALYARITGVRDPACGIGLAGIAAMLLDTAAELEADN